MIKKICTLALAIFICFSFCGCAPKYSSTDCESPIRYCCEVDKYYYKPSFDILNYNKKIEENGLNIYYVSNLSGRKINNAVDALKRVQVFCDIPQPVFLIDNAVTYVNDGGLWINCGDSAELIGAVILENFNSGDIPFGFFAGISANIISEDFSFSVYNDSRLKSGLEEYPYVKELQYPLFISRYADKDERNAAWNFAFKIGEFWLNSHSVDELQTLTNEHLRGTFEQFGVQLPFYRFNVGDMFYPLNVSAKKLNYYFAYNFADCELSDDYFTLKYSSVKDFITENDRMLCDLTDLYGYSEFAQTVNCFFGRADEYGQYRTGHSDFGRNALCCYSTGIFGHELMHWVHYFAGNNYGTFDESIYSFFGIKFSTPAKAIYFRDYQLEFKNRFAGGRYSEEEIATIKQARKLYNDVLGKCSFSQFDINMYINAVAYAYNSKSSKLNLIQCVSFLNYIYDKYGFATMIKISVDGTSVNIDGKTFKNFTAEWVQSLNATFS